MRHFRREGLGGAVDRDDCRPQLPQFLGDVGDGQVSGTPRFGDLKVREIRAVAADGYGDASSLGGF